MALVKIPSEGRTLGRVRMRSARFLAALRHRVRARARRRRSLRRAGRRPARARSRRDRRAEGDAAATSPPTSSTSGPTTPNLDAMLAKFSTRALARRRRSAVHRRRPRPVSHPSAGAPVFAIEVEAGDLIRVPRGTHHWFDLCADRRIRAIRLFQDPSGWTPHYTESGVGPGLPAGVLRARVHPADCSAPRPCDAQAARERARRRPPRHRRDDDADRVRARGAVSLRTDVPSSRSFVRMSIVPSSPRSLNAFAPSGGMIRREVTHRRPGPTNLPARSRAPP